FRRGAEGVRRAAGQSTAEPRARAGAHCVCAGEEGAVQGRQGDRVHGRHPQVCERKDLAACIEGPVEERGEQGHH
ncbi:hypothetical protein LTR53_019152, partial [Teratosphaeriaceae sp. CCFEE 6253]